MKVSPISNFRDPVVEGLAGLEEKIQKLAAFVANALGVPAVCFHIKADSVVLDGGVLTGSAPVAMGMEETQEIIAAASFSQRQTSLQQSKAIGPFNLIRQEIRLGEENVGSFIACLAPDQMLGLKDEAILTLAAQKAGALLDPHKNLRSKPSPTASSQTFLTLMEQAPFSMQVFSKDGKTTRVNKAWENLWGVTLDQIPDYNVLQDPQLEAKGILPFLRRAFEGEAVQIPPIEYDPNETLPDRTKHSDPKRYVSAMAYPVFSHEKEVIEVVLIHQDITEQRQAQAALGENEERLRLATEASQLIVWDMDLKTRRVKCNQNALSLWGFTEASANEFYDRIHPEDAEKVKTNGRNGIKEGVPYSVEYRVITEANEIRWLQSLGRVINDRDGEPSRFVGVSVDITDRKRAEEKLAEGEKKLQLVTDSLPALISYVDTAFRYKFANAAYEDWLGLSPEWIKEKHIREVVGDEIFIQRYSYLEKALEGERIQFEAITRHKRLGFRDTETTYIPDLGLDGGVRGFFVFVHDITDHKHTLRRLQDSESRFRTLVSVITDVPWTTDASGAFVHHQPAWEAYTGQGWEEHQGFGWLAAIHPQDRERVQTIWEAACRNKTPYQSRGKIWNKGTKRWRHFYAQGTPLLTDDGTVRGWVGACTDVDDQKRAEERLAVQYHTSRVLVESHTIEEAAREVLEQICSTMGWASGSVWLSNGSGSDLQCAVFWGNDKVAGSEFERQTRSIKFPPGIGLPGRVFLTAEPAWIPEITKTDNFPRKKFAEETGLVSAVAFPIKFRSRVLGVVECFSDEELPPDSEFLEAAAAMGNQMGQFLERKNAEEELTSLKDRLAFELRDTQRLHRLNSRLLSDAGLQPLLKEVLLACVELTGTDKGNVQLFDPSENALKIVAHTGFSEEFLKEFAVVPNDFSVCGCALGLGKRLMVENALEDSRFVHLATRYQTHGFISVQSTPLIGANGKVLGMISTHFAKPHQLTEREEKLLDLFAQEAVRVIERKQGEEITQRLFELAAAVNRAKNLHEVFEAAINSICLCYKAKFASILLFEADGVMRFKAWRGLSDHYRQAVEGHSPWKPGEMNPQCVCLENLEKVELPKGLKEVISAEGIKALAFIPIVNDKRLLGKFMIYHAVPHEFSREELSLASIIASQIAFAVERHQSGESLERLVTERTRSLQEAVQQMEEFSYTVSHDLRAPLRALQGYSQALLDDYGPVVTGQGSVFLKRLVENSARLDQMIMDVLTYSKVARAELSLKPLSLDKIVRDLVRDYAVIQSSNAQITIETLHDVMGHEASLVQAISNLLTNSIKFVKPGLTPELRIWSGTIETRVTLWIQDNGIGIDPQYHARLFKMFERMHPHLKYEGTGVGLAIVRKAVERMGGKVGVESTAGSGSRFWIELQRGEEIEA